MHNSGQQQNVFSDITLLVPVVENEFNFPANGIVDLTPAFSGTMSAENNIKTNVASGNRIYTGSLVLSESENQRMIDICSQLKTEYTNSQNENYSIEVYSTYCGTVSA